MTETLQTALDQLLRALEESRPESPDGDRLALLRARLLADLSEALAGEGTIEGLDETTLLNEIAAHLDGLPVPDREALTALLAQSPRGRAALQSAASFLADVDKEAKPVSAAQLDAAMAVFAPEPARVAAAAAAPPSARKFGWQIHGLQGWASVAAVLLVGIVGGSEFWHFNHVANAPPTSPKAAMQGQAPQPTAGNEGGVQRAQPAVASRPAPADSTCDLTLREGNDRLAKKPPPSAGQFKSLKEEEKPPKPPCPPDLQAAPPQPHLPSGSDQH
jgi:hypothetical protein